jgi:hypothetical protein
MISLSCRILPMALHARALLRSTKNGNWTGGHLPAQPGRPADGALVRVMGVIGHDPGDSFTAQHLATIHSALGKLIAVERFESSRPNGKPARVENSATGKYHQVNAAGL